MECTNSSQFSMLKLAVFVPTESSLVEQKASCQVLIHRGDSYEVFKNLYKESADLLFFLTPNTDIVDSGLIESLLNEVEDGVGIYYNSFVNIENPKSKILSIINIYNKQEVKSFKSIIQAPILIQSKFLSGFSFNPNIKILNNFSLLLYLTDHCMFKRSKYIIDGMKPMQFNIENDIKILNEQSRP
jgi:hypothetical protein